MLSPKQDEAGDGARRPSGRTRQVSQKMAVVSDQDRDHVLSARLAALEDGGGGYQGFGEDSDDEFELGDDDEAAGGKRKKGRARKPSRKTRAQAAGQGAKSLQGLVVEAALDSSAGPNYLSAAAAPPTTGAQRRWCSVCGFAAPYTCARCGSRFCMRKCYAIHSETRCLKFTA